LTSQFWKPNALAYDRTTRTLYVGDTFNSCIRSVDANG
jgi:hypothetical protein